MAMVSAAWLNLQLYQMLLEIDVARQPSTYQLLEGVRWLTAVLMVSQVVIATPLPWVPRSNGALQYFPLMRNGSVAFLQVFILLSIMHLFKLLRRPSNDSDNSASWESQPIWDSDMEELLLCGAVCAKA